jgi:signal transduction histidine kinase
MLSSEIYGPLVEKQKWATDRILANGHQLLTLINDMIDQAELEAGRLELQDRTFNIIAHVEDICSMLSTQAKAKGLSLTTEVADKMPEVLVGDEQRIRQILVNLVNNAIKFTEEGSVKIHLYLPDSEHWAVGVSDTGRGIPQDAQNYVFDPFRQVDGSPTREHGGVGLGLSLVRHLVRLMEGRIELESTVEQGSTFTVILPLVLPQEEQP